MGMHRDWNVKSSVARGFLPRQGFASVLSDMFSQQCRDTGKKAFTLAEVLITLGIIGIVASMTLPTLIQKNQDKELISRTKKAYSELTNALLLAQRDLGTVGDNSTLFNTTDTSQIVAENLKKYFKGAFYCKNYSQKGCSKYYYDVKYAVLQLDDNNGGSVAKLASYPKLILPNGEIVAVINGQRPNCIKEETTYETDEYGRPVLDAGGNKIYVTYTSTMCGYVFFDVNGPKNPNQFGRDVYQLFITKNGTTFSNISLGSESLKNILTGKDKLEYYNYSKGQVFEF